MAQFVNDLHPKTKEQKTPLDLANKAGHNEVVNYLKNPIFAHLNQLTGVNDCTICFEERIETYALYPCGHATFCTVCALQLFENGDKKCPNCRRQIKDTFRLYLK